MNIIEGTIFAHSFFNLNWNLQKHFLHLGCEIPIFSAQLQWAQMHSGLAVTCEVHTLYMSTALLLGHVVLFCYHEVLLILQILEDDFDKKTVQQDTLNKT